MIQPTEVPPEMKKPKAKKLSKTERKRLRLLAAIQLKKTLIREQLLRQLELTKKSLKHGKSQWEKLCSDIKLRELREEIEMWGEKTERLLHKKDEKIEMLLKNIDETQDLRERSLSHHLDVLEYLSKCHATFKEAATALFEMQASEMIKDFMSELSTVKEVHEAMKLNNENIMHTSNIVTAEKLKRTHENYMNRKFDEVTAEIGKRYELRDQTVKKMRVLQDQLLRWMKELEGDMVDVQKTSKFLYFMQRQRNYVKESTKLNEVERLSQKTISELQHELLSFESDFHRKIYGLKMEQAYFLEVRSIIKNAIVRDKQQTHDKLLDVASESHRVINSLREIVKRGELLLSIGVCCRKYKTQKEKVLPFAFEIVDLNPNSEYMFKMKFDIMKHLDITEEELVDHVKVMQNFWRRCSDVRLHNIMLMEERKKLNEENEKYRNVIRSLKKSDDVQYILKSLNITPIEIEDHGVTQITK